MEFTFSYHLYSNWTFFELMHELNFAAMCLDWFIARNWVTLFLPE